MLRRTWRTMALGGLTLKSTTMLEQLLEEINFQRTKEMRQQKDGKFTLVALPLRPILLQCLFIVLHALHFIVSDRIGD